MYKGGSPIQVQRVTLNYCVLHELKLQWMSKEQASAGAELQGR